MGERLDAERCAVTVGRQRGTSALAGVELDSPAMSVWHFENDRLARVEFYNEREPALRAAGLL